MQQKYEEGGPQPAGEPRDLTYLQRLLQPGGQEAEMGQSLGTALLPFLLALAEACWFQALLIGLAGLDFLQSRAALLPFWGVPLLFCASLWLFRRGLVRESTRAEEDADQGQGSRTLAGFGPLFGVLALLDVLLVWLHVYAGSFFLLDPRWLLSFVNDLLSLNTNFYQVLLIVIISIYFCWRATKLGQMKIDPGHVRRQLWMGLLALPVAILLRAGQGRAAGNLDDSALVILVPAFFYFILSAHALARTTFLRRVHVSGMEGNVAAQERALLSIIGGAGLVMLVLALLGGFVFSSAFLNSLQPLWQGLSTAYSWLVGQLSWLLTWILIPIFWLIGLLTAFVRRRPLPPSPFHPTNIKKGLPPSLVTQSGQGVAAALHVVVPFLLLLGVSLALWLALRRRKRLRAARRKASGDVHESIWSWQLFWRQFKAFLAALFGRRASSPNSVDEAESTAELIGEPAARTMRAIYRALLKKAAALGLGRRRYETPYEFQARLNRLNPDVNNEPQLGQLTDAYALTRYGGNEPGAFDLAGARRSWEELEQKWDASYHR